MFAIVNIAGKQYRVAEGDQIKVASLSTEAGEKIKFDQVLLMNDGKEVRIGEPIVKDVSISGTVLDNGRERKVIVFKKKTAERLSTEKWAPSKFFIDSDR